MDPPAAPPESSASDDRHALPTDSPPPRNQTSPRNSSGWDGKLRVEKRAEVVHEDIDSEHSDEDAPEVERIAADEGG